VIVIPEYVIEHHPLVQAWLSRMLTFAEREELAAGTLSQFDCGLWEHQKSLSLAWMRRVLADQRISEGEAASRLGVDRGTLNRWINGKVDPPFAQWQRFYACFGGRNKNDHPFQPRAVLNLGGYLGALAYVQEWLGQRGEDRGPRLAASSPTLETFLCLYHFYANHTPEDALSWMDDPYRSRFVDSIIKEIASLISSDKRDRLFPQDFHLITVRWGWAWLISLTQISDAEGDDKRHFISAKRPVLIDSGKMI